jgi:hypothetical protein
MKRLYINPVTRTIAPKYRTQKAVYIAKNDHNSVLLLSEIPKIVDGHDITVDGNIINIHYANISKDETSVSRGMSEAEDVTVDDEEGTVTFGWRVPNTATRYAGVVSIGITIERYEDVDGTPQEVYSWSTAPYGGTIVQDSMDNSDEVCEGDFDYLAKTCNAIVDLALKDKVTEAIETIDNKLTEAEADINQIADKVREDSQTAEEMAIEAESLVHGGMGIRENEDTDNALYYCDKAMKLAKSAGNSAFSANASRGDAETARDEAKTARDEAKTARDEAKEHADNAKEAMEYSESIKLICSNALKGKAKGTNAIIIDDVSPISNLQAKLSPTTNHIDQDEFFSVNEYVITGEIGKTYTLTCKVRDEYGLRDVTSRIDDAWTDENGETMLFNHFFIRLGEIEHSELSITIQEGHTYTWSTERGDARNIFESVSMIRSGVLDNISVDVYNKNISGYDPTKAVEEQWTYDNPNSRYFSLGEIDFTAVVSVDIPSPNGNVQLEYKKEDGTWSFIYTFVSGTDARKPYFLIDKPTEYRIRGTNKGVEAVTNVQLEVGTVATDIVTSEYIDEFATDADGKINISFSEHDTITLVVRGENANIDVEYNKDINSAIAKLENAIAKL